jgi:Cft2 family RNA processing exonuclease
MLKTFIGVGAIVGVSVTLINVGGIHIYINGNLPTGSSNSAANPLAPMAQHDRIKL